MKLTATSWPPETIACVRPDLGLTGCCIGSRMVPVPGADGIGLNRAGFGGGIFGTGVWAAILDCLPLLAFWNKQ